MVQLVDPEPFWGWLFSVDCATFYVEGQFVVFRAVYFRCILHDYNVQWCKVVCLNSKNPINACNQRSILRFLEVLDQVVQHVKENLLFYRVHSLDQKPVVIRKEEERTTEPSTLTSLEHHVAVVFDGEGIHQVLWSDVVEVHNLQELFLGMTDNLRPDIHVQCSS